MAFSSSSIEKIPLIELEDDEDEMMVIPPILPEHHVTLPPGKVRRPILKE